MQTLEVSDVAYQKFMKYCKETGQSASAALSRAPAALREIDRIDEEYAQSGPVISHKDLCKRYGLIE